MIEIVCWSLKKKKNLLLGRERWRTGGRIAPGHLIHPHSPHFHTQSADYSPPSSVMASTVGPSSPLRCGHSLGVVRWRPAGTTNSRLHLVDAAARRVVGRPVRDVRSGEGPSCLSPETPSSLTTGEIVTCVEGEASAGSGGRRGAAARCTVCWRRRSTMRWTRLCGSRPNCSSPDTPRSRPSRRRSGPHQRPPLRPAAFGTRRSSLHCHQHPRPPMMRPLGTPPHDRRQLARASASPSRELLLQAMEQVQITFACCFFSSFSKFAMPSPRSCTSAL